MLGHVSHKNNSINKYHGHLTSSDCTCPLFPVSVILILLFKKNEKNPDLPRECRVIL